MFFKKSVGALLAGFVSCLGVLALLIASPSSFAAAGGLDPSFGTGGLVRTTLATDTQAYSSALLPDGRLLVAGIVWDSNTNLQRVLLARYEKTGALDASFGVNGSAMNQLIANGHNNSSLANALAVQADGKIVVAGSTQYDGRNWIPALARFNSDGNLDGTFGVQGVVTPPFSAKDSQHTSIALQTDGKIVAAGYGAGDTGYLIRVFRYNAEGSVDGSFGQGGVTEIAASVSGDNFVNGLAIQSDGKLVVAGALTAASGANSGFLLRFNTDGSKDSSFGQNGIVNVSLGLSDLSFNQLLLQTDGKFFVVGRGQIAADYVFALARFNTNGSLDTSFGSVGLVTTVVGTHDSAYGVTVQPDGKMVVGGHSQVSGNGYVFALARYNANGTLDTHFGNGGLVRTPIGSIDDLIWSVSLAPDGMLLAVGNSQIDTDSNNQIVIARYLGDAVTSPAFQPQAGLWIIDAENNGQRGRGFQLETFSGTLVTTYYGYSAGGPATWYLAAGPLSNCSFSGSMTQYQGGTALGGAYSPASANGTAGTVSLTFTSASTGTITLPGEAAKSISKFPFAGAGITAILPSNGLWVINSENNGQSGRGFQLEQNGGAVVFTYYGYTASGQATWYLAAGSISGNTFTTALLQFRGGTVLGGPYSPSTTAGSPGLVSITFTSPTTGTITLPGEAPREISKFWW